MVTVSPTRCPVARNSPEPATTSPGPAYHRPEMSGRPTQVASPSYDSTVTGSVYPVSAASISLTPTTRAVPGWDRTVARTVAGSAVSGSVPPPLVGPSRKMSTSTGTGPVRIAAAETRSSDVASPAANTTVTAPSRTATSVTAVRAGRANGVPSPYRTGNGSGVPAIARRIRYPRPVPGARPTLIACVAGSRPARVAGSTAASAMRAGMPTAAATSTQPATPPVVATEYARPACASNGSASRLPSGIPTRLPTRPGNRICPVYPATT